MNIEREKGNRKQKKDDKWPMLGIILELYRCEFKDIFK